VTSYPDAKIRARATEAGAFAFLGKPFGHDELSAHILAALSTRT
jgi:FixJ family two-component response regulator